MAMLFETSSIAVKRARLTAIVMIPSRKITMRPARSRLRGIFRLRIIGKGSTNTIETSDEATYRTLAFVLSTSEVMFRDQLSLTRVIAVNTVHSPSSIALDHICQSHLDVTVVNTYQLSAGSGPHQKVSPKKVVRVDNMTKPVTAYNAFRVPGDDMGIIMK
jgi:hypothetical protein